MRDPAKVSHSQPISPPINGSAYLDAAQMAWQPTDIVKFWVKPLCEDSAKGVRTLFMKIDPGAFAPLHAHGEFEQFYVLEGSLYDQEKVMKAGDYVCRAAGAMHTSGSEEGAVVLLIYTKAIPSIAS